MRFRAEAPYTTFRDTTNPTLALGEARMPLAERAARSRPAIERGALMYVLDEGNAGFASPGELPQGVVVALRDAACREEVLQALVVSGDELPLKDELGLKRRERGALDGSRVVGKAAQEVALVPCRGVMPGVGARRPCPSHLIGERGDS